MSREEVFNHIDSHFSEIIHYLKDIVSIKSDNDVSDINCDKEMNVQNYIEKSLKDMGLVVEKFCADEQNRRPNVCARLKGSGNGNDLILNGHVDTVMGNMNFHDSIPSIFWDNYIFC